ncbi:hypothetical protein F5146DRAFT_231424 [Armillaria mellea]|nr:hypothetical protein F5146DRAFT_231424 [Armillaria mellea]
MVRGVLFINEAHMLDIDIECFSFFNRALENDVASLDVMSCNRGRAHNRGATFPVRGMGYLWISSTASSLSAPNRIVKQEIANHANTVPRRGCDYHCGCYERPDIHASTTQTTLLNLVSCAHGNERRSKGVQRIHEANCPGIEEGARISRLTRLDNDEEGDQAAMVPLPREDRKLVV